VKRLVPFILVIVLAVGLLVTPFALFRPDRYKQTLIDQFSKAFGHPVLISKVEGGYFPPTLKMVDLSVLQSGDARYLHVDRAEARLPWSALWGAAPMPSQLTVQGFQVTIQRRADGSWDLNDWLSVFSGASSGGSRAAVPLVLSGGQVRWIDAYAPQKTELVAEGVEGRLTAAALQLKGNLSGAAIPTAFQLDTQALWGNREGSGELRLTDGARSATLRLQRQAGQWKCDADSVEWRLDHLWSLSRFVLRLGREEGSASGSPFVRNWKAQYASTVGTGTFSSSAGLEQGAVELKGTLQSVAGIPVVRLGLALQGVPVPALFPILGSSISGMDGKVTGLLSDFEMPLSTQSWQMATGNITFEAMDGAYRLPASSLQYLQKAKTSRYLRKKFPDLDEKGLPILKARLSGRFENGGVTIHSAGWVAGSLSAGFTGRLENAPRSIEGYVQVQIQEKSPVLLRELPERYVYGEGGREKVQPIYGRVLGNWSEWKLRSTSRSRIPSAAQRKLREGSSSVVSK